MYGWGRWLLVALGIKKVTPRFRELLPQEWHEGPGTEGDTGGGGWYRPPHRKQDPAADPAEPTNESSGAGNDHGWSNCTLASGAMALNFHTLGDIDKWGGHLRHRQGDLQGGTDLYDLRDAWASYGETLTIRSGAGWDALVEDRKDGRYIVIQGEGDVPGSATFDGGHACVIGPETNDAGNWLWGDPLAGGWQFVSPGAIKSWAQRWNSGISYAISAPHKPASTQPPEPEPEPPDSGGPTQAEIDAAIATAEKHAAWEADAKRADATFASWLDTDYLPTTFPAVARWDHVAWEGDAIPLPFGEWGESWPIPFGDYVTNLLYPATFGGARWSGSTWR